MGDFRIVIDTVGGHGQDRDNEGGSPVNFGENTPEAYFKKCVEEAISKGIISSDTKAKVIHWPTDNYPESRNPEKQIVDDLLTGERTGSFKRQ